MGIASDHLTEAEAKLDSANSAIFQIATGALALSITFRSEIASDAAVAKWILSLSWVCLAVVPIAFVFMRLLEANLALAWHTQSRAARASKGSDERSQQLEVSTKSRNLTAGYSVLWKAMLYGFLGGVFFLLLFGIINNGV